MLALQNHDLVFSCSLWTQVSITELNLMVYKSTEQSLRNMFPPPLNHVTVNWTMLLNSQNISQENEWICPGSSGDRWAVELFWAHRKQGVRLVEKSESWSQATLQTAGLPVQAPRTGRTQSLSKERGLGDALGRSLALGRVKQRAPETGKSWQSQRQAGWFQRDCTGGSFLCLCACKQH